MTTKKKQIKEEIKDKQHWLQLCQNWKEQYNVSFYDDDIEVLKKEIKELEAALKEESYKPVEFNDIVTKRIIGMGTLNNAFEKVDKAFLDLKEIIDPNKKLDSLKEKHVILHELDRLKDIIEYDMAIGLVDKPFAAWNLEYRELLIKLSLYRYNRNIDDERGLFKKRV